MTAETDLTDEDAANIGRALMETLHSAYPAYSWMDCPSEIVCDLLNDRDEARNEIERLRKLLSANDTTISYKCSECGSFHLRVVDAAADRPAYETTAHRATETDLAQHCTRAADVYRKSPGLVGPTATVDLYEIVGMLAQRVTELEKERRNG